MVPLLAKAQEVLLVELRKIPFQILMERPPQEESPLVSYRDYLVAVGVPTVAPDCSGYPKTRMQFREKPVFAIASLAGCPEEQIAAYA